MAMNPSTESRARYWRRVLRPLLLWLLMVLVMYAIRTHQRLMAQTRLKFTASLEGNRLYAEPTVTFDGKPAYDGQLISLGSHQFMVTHPKGVTFATNLFTWYGGHDLGHIKLPRAMGTLQVKASPAAGQIVIRGPEYRDIFTNSSGVSVSLPTDQYEVEVYYKHWKKSQTTQIYRASVETVSIAPRMGALTLTCNQSNATFKLSNSRGELLEAGDFPATLVELPEGVYKLAAEHHGHRWALQPEIRHMATNDIVVEFKYGAAVLETKPSGATVTSGDGEYWGVTPLKIGELQPGNWQFTFRLDRYEPVTTPLAVVADETATVRTNLSSLAYIEAMRQARQAIAASDYERAVDFLNDALLAQPDDPVASVMLREATGHRSIHRAEVKAKREDFIAAGLELNEALKYLPGDERATQLAAEYKRREPEQLERMRIERLGRGKKVFEAALHDCKDSGLFEAYEAKTAKPVNAVRAEILAALKNQAGLRTVLDNAPAPETFLIKMEQEFSTILSTTAGLRVYVVVCSQTKDDETQVLFKDLEYKTEAVNKFSIGNLIGAPGSFNYVALHPSRAGQLTEKQQLRLAEGLANLSIAVQTATGQTPVPVTPPAAP